MIIDNRPTPVYTSFAEMRRYGAGHRKPAILLSSTHRGVYVFDKQNTDDDNGLTIIAPTGISKGRWVQVITEEQLQDKYNGYDLVLTVDGINGDDAIGDPYKTITAATNAAEQEYLNKGLLTQVRVRKGTYPEKSITRHMVDMHFDEGAVVYCTGDGESVINDLGYSSGATFKITGKGRFYNTFNRGSSDADAINLRYDSKPDIEFKEISSINVWSGFTGTCHLRNGTILFTMFGNNGSTIIMDNIIFRTTFWNFCYYQSYGVTNIFNDCEFIVPDYGEVATFTTLKDYAGNTITDELSNPVVISVTNSGTDTDLSGFTQQQIIDTESLKSGFTYINGFCWIENTANNWGNNFSDVHVELNRCTIRVRKPKAVGLTIASRYDNPNCNLVIDNLLILDETADKSAIAVNAGQLDTVTDGLKYASGIIQTDCATTQVVPSGYVPMPERFAKLGAGTKYTVVNSISTADDDANESTARAINLDLDLGTEHPITLGTYTALTLTNGKPGKYVLEVKQDATGYRELDIPNLIDYNGVIALEPNAVSVLFINKQGTKYFLENAYYNV